MISTKYKEIVCKAVEIVMVVVDRETVEEAVVEDRDAHMVF